MYQEHLGSMEREIFCTIFINCIDSQKARECIVEQSERKLKDDHFYKGTISITAQMKEMW